MRLALIPLILLAGCAASPEQMAQQSNYEVCRFTMGGPHSAVAQGEANRRGLDCTPYYPAIAGKLQQENQATSNLINAINPPRPAPTQTNCTSQRVGNTIQTSCR